MIRLQWTPEIDAEMDDLLKSKTTKQVAAYLSWKYGVPVSKNMVCGRRFRNVPPELRAKRRKRLDLFGRSIEELELRDCAFPYGDQPPYRFCGKRAKSGSPYCTEHHAKCFRVYEPEQSAKSFKAGVPKHQIEKAA